MKWEVQTTWTPSPSLQTTLKPPSPSYHLDPSPPLQITLTPLPLLSLSHHLDSPAPPLPSSPVQTTLTPAPSLPSSSDHLNSLPLRLKPILNKIEKLTLPDSFKYFRSCCFSAFHSPFHGNNNGVSFVICAMFR